MKTKEFDKYVIVKVKKFRPDIIYPDRNGKMPVILKVLAGKAPDKVVFSGTVAEERGYEINKIYLMQIIEMKKIPIYGRQFNWKKLKEFNKPKLLKL